MIEIASRSAIPFAYEGTRFVSAERDLCCERPLQSGQNAVLLSSDSKIKQSCCPWYTRSPGRREKGEGGALLSFHRQMAGTEAGPSSVRYSCALARAPFRAPSSGIGRRLAGHVPLPGMPLSPSPQGRRFLYQSPWVSGYRG